MNISSINEILVIEQVEKAIDIEYIILVSIKIYVYNKTCFSLSYETTVIIWYN